VTYIFVLLAQESAFLHTSIISYTDFSLAYHSLLGYPPKREYTISHCSCQANYVIVFMFSCTKPLQSTISF
jgi:hypothetical protein